MQQGNKIGRVHNRMVEKKFKFLGRIIVIVWFLPWIYLPGVNFVYSALGPSNEWYWFDLVYYYYYHGLFAVTLLLAGSIYKTPWRVMLKTPATSEYRPALELTAFNYVFSVFCVYLVFLPLSFLVPEFVQYWYLSLPPIIYGSPENFPLLANLLSLVSLVVLAPVLEELAFRGVLLHRWVPKYGKTKAILFSSLIFGLAHPDPLGAAAFGVAMSVIYLRSQSLLLPMLCHSLYNLTVWIYSLWYFNQQSTDLEVKSIADFQSEVIYAAISFAMVCVWVFFYLRRKGGSKSWRLPAL